MDAIDCLKSRRSVRLYTDEPVSRAVIEDIVDCGRLAASANNVQPWLFVAVDDPGLRRKLADIAEYGRFIAQAPVCVVVFCRDTHYFLEDGSAATQNLLNAAAAHGLGSCWVAGDKKPYAPQVADLLGVPAPYRLVSLVAVGHPAESPSPRKRPLGEVMRWNRW